MAEKDRQSKNTESGPYPIDESPLIESEAVHHREAEETIDDEKMKGVRAQNRRRKNALF